jgi:protein-serine/threonine kinase
MSKMLIVQEFEWWRTNDDTWNQRPKRYVKLKSLGRGAFSKVVLVEPFDPDDSQEQLAIKVVSLDATEDASADRITSSARRELDILKKCSHPCITRLLAYKELPDKCLFGLQYSPGGDLFDFASKHRELLTPLLVKRIFKELTLAVQYLHESMHVVHRDLKLESKHLLNSTLI